MCAQAQRELLCRCLWKGRHCQLILHYDNGFSLIESGTSGSGSLLRNGIRTLWRFPFDRLRSSADDGNRLLWLDFGGDDGEIVSGNEMNPGIIEVRSATHLFS